jgi:hypothetical protein
LYKYIYVEAETSGVFRTANHQELIEKYSSMGWRFVTAIPTKFSGYGLIKSFDLVFEMEE